MSDVSVFPVSTRPLPAGFLEAGFDGDIAFRPAYDRRDEKAGIAGLSLTFWLRGPRGGVDWELMTGCFLPHTMTQWLSQFGNSAYKPAAGPVCWHSPEPQRENDTPLFDCRLLGPGNPCYGDSGYLIGNEAYDALVSGGEPSLWLFLRKMYDSRFAGSEGTPAVENTL